MAVSGVLGKGNLDGLSVRVELPAEIYAGRQALLTLHLASRGRLPRCLLEFAAAGGQTLVPVLRRNEPLPQVLPVTFARRGLVELPPLAVTSIFPVNFFIRRTTIPLERTALVFPAPRPCPPPEGGGERQQRSSPRLRMEAGQDELRGIGSYSGTEPLKQIHWKLSARHDQLLIKELGGARRQPLWIDVPALPGASLEERLGGAVHLVNRGLKEGRPVGLRLPGQSFPPASGQAHRLKLLSALATYDRDPHPR